MQMVVREAPSRHRGHRGELIAAARLPSSSTPGTCN